MENPPPTPCPNCSGEPLAHRSHRPCMLKIENKINTGNRRELIPSEEDDICAICHHELGAYGDLNSLVCNHSYYHQCILGWIKITLTGKPSSKL
ncbi:hypothetical protein YC2023_059582 [Brassica napus]